MNPQMCCWRHGIHAGLFFYFTSETGLHSSLKRLCFTTESLKKIGTDP